MNIVTSRVLVRRFVAECNVKIGWHGKEKLSRDAHGRMLLRVAGLDPEAVTGDEVLAIYLEMTKGGGRWPGPLRMLPVCYECGREVPLVVEFDANGHEGEVCRPCPDCLAKAVELAGAAVPA